MNLFNKKFTSLYLLNQEGRLPEPIEIIQSGGDDDWVEIRFARTPSQLLLFGRTIRLLNSDFSRQQNAPYFDIITDI